ncbi:hypothetical protein SNARM312S_04350 [Streptomyces narbonensis]
MRIRCGPATVTASSGGGSQELTCRLSPPIGDVEIPEEARPSCPGAARCCPRSLSSRCSPPARHRRPRPPPPRSPEGPRGIPVHGRQLRREDHLPGSAEARGHHEPARHRGDAGPRPGEVARRHRLPRRRDPPRLQEGLRRRPRPREGSTLRRPCSPRTPTSCTAVTPSAFDAKDGRGRDPQALRHRHPPQHRVLPVRVRPRSTTSTAKSANWDGPSASPTGPRPGPARRGRPSPAPRSGSRP